LKRLYCGIHGACPPSLELPSNATPANGFPRRCAHEQYNAYALFEASCSWPFETALAREDGLSSTASYRHVGGPKATSSEHSLLKTLYIGMMAALGCGERLNIWIMLPKCLHGSKRTPILHCPQSDVHMTLHLKCIHANHALWLSFGSWFCHQTCLGVA
jgi:hypothetical protein